MAAIVANSLDAVTHDLIVPLLEDEVTNKGDAGFAAFKSMGGIVEHKGADDVTAPIVVQETPAGEWYTGAKTFTVNTFDDIGKAVYGWSFYGYPWRIVHTTYSLNQDSPQKVISILTSSYEQAKRRTQDTLLTRFFGASTAAADLQGLKDAVAAANPGFGGNFGDRDRVADTKWQATRITAASPGNWLTAAGKVVPQKTALQRQLRILAKNQSTGSGLGPNLVLMESNVYDKFRARYDDFVAVPNLNTTMQDWTSFKINERAWAYPSEYIDSGFIYLINLDHIKLYVHPTLYFKDAGWRELDKSRDLFNVIHFCGFLWANSCQKLGRVEDLETSL